MHHKFDNIVDIWFCLYLFLRYIGKVNLLNSLPKIEQTFTELHSICPTFFHRYWLIAESEWPPGGATRWRGWHPRADVTDQSPSEVLTRGSRTSQYQGGQRHLLSLILSWLIYPLACIFSINGHAALDRNQGLIYNTILLRLIPGDLYSACPHRLQGFYTGCTAKLP